MKQPWDPWLTKMGDLKGNSEVCACGSIYIGDDLFCYRCGVRRPVDIDQLPAAIIIARRSRLLVITNLCLALAINVLVILLAATVGLPLWLSVLSDTGGLLVVLANSLWPLTWRVGKDPTPERRSSFG